MRKIASIAILCFGILLTGTELANATTCFASCTSADGYNVQVISNGSSWEMTIRFGKQEWEYRGEGPYTGTACGGFMMCNKQ